ncbi:MAG: class I SAM-dependent methyltransferase [Pseudobdellovibrionaceae bacterium]
MKLSIQFQQKPPQSLLQEFKVVESELQFSESQNPSGSYFVYDEQGLSFFDDELGKLHLDFLNSKDYVRQAHRGKSELIAKAVGLHRGRQRVFDATVGLAQDAWFLSQLGAEVEGCERSPVVYLLLADALCRAPEAKLKIHFGDSLQWISEGKSDFSVVYIDPMFPEKKKSALPRKEMRIFRKWVGEDLDAEKLVQTALQSPAERVVVKRPLKAPEILSGVVHSFEGQTVRYDLYSPVKGSH